MTNLSCLILAAAFVSAGALAMAQDIRTERIAFAPGASSTTVQDEIRGWESVSYLVGAEAGQRMVVGLEASNGATYFNVYPPGSGPGDEALATGDLIGPMMPDLNSFDGVLPASGDYTISVYLFRNAARREETSAYTLTVTIPPLDAAIPEPTQGDLGDGFQGGPTVRTSEMARAPHS